MEVENKENKETAKPETLEVDIPGGSRVKLPYDEAKRIIEMRDKYENLLKDQGERSKRQEEYKKKAEDAERRAQMAEAVKTGALEEAERIASSKIEDKLNRLKNGLIKREIKAALVSHPEFLPDAADDALNLILATVQGEYGDDDSVKLGGKDVKTAVDEFVKSKPIFRKAAGGVTKKRDEPTGEKKPQNGKSISELLAERMTKIKG
jgi:hypothetical protein